MKEEKYDILDGDLVIAREVDPVYLMVFIRAIFVGFPHPITVTIRRSEDDA